MCVSATTSFVAAAGLTAIGSAIIYKKPVKNHRLMAFVPLLFALQQFTEGFVWLSLVNEADFGCVQSWSAGLYLSFALVIWPFLLPLSVYLFEASKRRRHFILPCVIIGAMVSVWEFYWVYIVLGYSVNIHDPSGYLEYVRNIPNQDIITYMYVTGGLLPFFLCSDNRVKLLGVLFVASLAASFVFYRPTYESVWCLAAALISAGIYKAIDYQSKGNLSESGSTPT